MTDLLGPGAFGAARTVTTRPVFDPGNAGGDPDTWVKDCSSPSLRDGSENRAAAANMLLAQLRRNIRATGVTPDNTDDFMLLRANRSQRMNWAGVFGGTANALTVTWTTANPAPVNNAERTGKPLRGVIQIANTSAVTIDGFPLKRRGGQDLAPADLAVGQIIDAIFDGTNYRLVAPLASDTQVIIAANKSLFNVVATPFTARASLSGTGMVLYQSGSYTKKSASSLLIVEVSTNLFSLSGTAAAFGRVTGLPTNLEFITRNGDTGTSSPASTGGKIYTGIGAGLVSWSMLFGRNDAGAWSSIVNPRSPTDAAFLPAETTTTITFSELEP